MAASDLPLPRRARRAADEVELRSLIDWRAEPAYVLLGDPGAGKSTSFRAEALSQAGVLVEASDIADGVADAEGLRDSVVFIDGLDQIKAHSRGHGLVPLGSIRAWLAKARPAGFRLSCREADWLGEAEQDALAKVAPDGQVTVLQLEPLTQDEAMVLLQRREQDIGDARAFWLAAEERQLTALFGNPLLLGLMVDAVAERGGQWPRTRSEVYEAACEGLVREDSPAHRVARPPTAGRQAQLLDTAGLLCALLLLSGRSAIALQHPAPPQVIDMAELPAELVLPDAAAALATKAFIAPGGLAQPRHRSIAEYLAARALARRLNEGLPLGRVLALIQGFDGHPVEALRGLLAWLVVEHLPSRSHLLQLDPLGFVLNGDPARLSTPQRLELLQALAKRAAENPWFRQGAWKSHPFGALVSADMADDILAILQRPERDQGHQVYIDCLLDGLLHSELMPALSPALAAWVADPAAYEGNRVTAMQAWQRHCPEADKGAQEREWLEAMKADCFSDPSDRLLGIVLQDAYPERIGPAEVLDYLRPQRVGGTLVQYTAFWEWHLLGKTRPGDAATLVDRWVQLFPSREAEPGHDRLRSLTGKLLAQALRESGDEISDGKLYEWLDIGADKYGIHTPMPESLAYVPAWLSARPKRLHAVLMIGYELVRPDDASARRYFWRAEERLLGAQRPRNHLRWLLDDVCASACDAELAHHVFAQVVGEVVDPGGHYDAPSLEDLENWAAAHDAASTPYVEWLSALTTWPLEHWRGDQHRRNVEHQRERSELLATRRQEWAASLLTLDGPNPDAWLMDHVACAMQGRGWDVEGELPEEKVQDLLDADAVVAQAAIAAVHRTLMRSDLPTAEETLRLSLEQCEPLLLAPALIAADQACVVDRQAPLSWSEPLCQTLVASYLVGRAGEMPFWYRLLAQSRPETVATVLIEYARSRPTNSARLPSIAAACGNEGHEVLAGRVLPELLRLFPSRVSAEAIRGLESHLLSALPRLHPAQAAALVTEKLADQTLSSRARISWLVADLRYRATAIDDIRACVANSRPRRLAVAESLERQALLSVEALPNEEEVLKTLIAAFAPLTRRRSRAGSGAYWVGAAERREDLVRALLNRLAELPSQAAQEALAELANAGGLGEWQATARYSIQAQRSVARQSSFVVTEPRAVALTLANHAPAHAADLKALLLDHLAGIAAELRGANDFALSQFWTDEGTPRDENTCRNLLLSKLRTRLEPLGVTVEPEAAAADQKRMDLKLSFAERAGKVLSLPVEVKKDNHAQLWTACRDQLQRLYAIDPRADGHGVYLVLWFDGSCPLNPDRPRPQNANELLQQLVGDMDEQVHQSISVYVLDLSWSRPNKGRKRRRKA